MIRTHTLILILALGSLASTCEQEVSLTLPQPQERMVVLCNFTPNQPFEVVVSRSQDLLSAQPASYVRDAEVRIFDEHNTLLANLSQFVESEDPDVAPFYTNTSFLPQVGQPYTLKVRAKGLDQVQATDAIPIPVPLQQVEIASFQLQPSDVEGIKRFQMQLHLALHDPPAQDNYYHLNLYQEVKSFQVLGARDTVWGPAQLLLAGIASSSLDAGILSELDNGLLFSDVHLDGQLIDLTLDADFFIAIPPQSERNYTFGDVYVELRSTSKAYYLYHSTLSRQRKSANTPFSEPVVIYNNIEQGLGNFSGYSIFVGKVTPPPQ